MSNYFKEIIFPPRSKTTVLYDINNRPMSSVTSHVSVKPQNYFDFWFVEIVDSKTEESRIQLIAACPVCNTSFIIRYNIKSREIMRHALEENEPFYISFVKNHCPKCCPNNPVPKDDSRN